MKFNRRLFKEAFKRGYKKAKTLNEETDKFGKYGPFFRSLCDLNRREGKDIKMVGRYFYSKGADNEECDVFCLFPNALFLFFEDDDRKVIDVEDVIKIERGGENNYRITLEDKSQLWLSVYKKFLPIDLNN